MKVYSPRDIRPFVMYCVNGKPRSSLLIESTDSDSSSTVDLSPEFGPANFGPGDQNFQWKIGPAGSIFSGKMVRLWKIGPGPPPSPAHQDGLSLAKCLTSAHVT